MKNTNESMVDRIIHKIDAFNDRLEDRIRKHHQFMEELDEEKLAAIIVGWFRKLFRKG